MYTLFIDSHLNTNVALFKDHNLLTNNVNNDARQSTKLMPLIEQMFIDNNLEPRDLGEILIVNGPGSFTGVRLGVTIAKTMAYSLNIPIRTITSIELLAMLDDYKNGLYGVLDSKGIYVGKNINDKFEINYNLKSEMDIDKIVTDVTGDISNIFKYYDKFVLCDPNMVNPIYIKKIEALK